MPAWQWLLVALVAALAGWCALLAALVLAGRREDARAMAGFVPDCVVLLRGLLGDPRLPRSRKWLLAGLLLYLASPIDLVPDFIPVVGQLDDAIVLVLVLRSVLRAGGPELIREHWRGPPRSLAAILRLVERRPA
jgi:uncharacterized membrane protein YkvA (DUF1232 family)